jgi:hypothetical protein
LRVYNQHIQIPQSTQQLFINIYSTTCFDPNGPFSGAASLTDSTTLQSTPYKIDNTTLTTGIRQCERGGVHCLGKVNIMIAIQRANIANNRRIW